VFRKCSWKKFNDLQSSQVTVLPISLMHTKIMTYLVEVDKPPQGMIKISGTDIFVGKLKHWQVIVRHLIWYDMIWYDMVWFDMIFYMMWYNIYLIYDLIYMIWYNMIWYDMIWYIWSDLIYDMIYICYDLIWYLIWYDIIWCDLIWYDMIWYDDIFSCSWVDTQ
jgi:hypothetical protein